jgi:hypothetical protein
MKNPKGSIFSLLEIIALMFVAGEALLGCKYFAAHTANDPTGQVHTQNPSDSPIQSFHYQYQSHGQTFSGCNSIAIPQNVAFTGIDLDTTMEIIQYTSIDCSESPYATAHQLISQNTAYTVILPKNS